LFEFANWLPTVYGMSDVKLTHLSYC